MQFIKRNGKERKKKFKKKIIFELYWQQKMFFKFDINLNFKFKLEF